MARVRSGRLTRPARPVGRGALAWLGLLPLMWAAVALLATPRRALAVAPPGLAVSIQRSAVGRPLASGFIGLSLEYRYVSAYTGTDPRHINPVLIALIRNLVPGQRPVLRIGGDSTDWTWWPVPGLQRPAGVSFNLSSSWLRIVRAFTRAAHARLILGINLEAGSPRLASVEARAVIAGIGRGRIEAFEIGNEPERYAVRWYRAQDGSAVPGRAQSYDFSAYRDDFSRFRKVLPRIALAGPATGSLSWLSHLSQLIAAEPSLRQVTVHRYPLSRCVTDLTSAQYPTVANLLSASASRGLLGGVGRYTAIAHRHGLSFRVDELNSVTCQGRSGVSNTFASALWILDTLFEMARAGVDAVNIHTWPGAVPNELFTFSRVHARWVGSVRPAYYGALMFTRACPPGSRLLRTLVAGGGNVRFWTVRAPDGSIRLTAIDHSLTRAYRVLIRPPGAPGIAELERLGASSATATGGVSLAGQTFGARTATGALTGRVRSTRLTFSRGGYRFTVPAASAALLVIGRSAGT